MSLSIDRDRETSHMLDTLNMLETFLRETLETVHLVWWGLAGSTCLLTHT